MHNCHGCMFLLSETVCLPTWFHHYGIIPESSFTCTPRGKSNTKSDWQHLLNRSRMSSVLSSPDAIPQPFSLVLLQSIFSNWSKSTFAMLSSDNFTQLFKALWWLAITFRIKFKLPEMVIGTCMKWFCLNSLISSLATSFFSNSTVKFFPLVNLLKVSFLYFFCHGVHFLKWKCHF